MKRVTVYLVLATLGMALFATSPAAARHCHRYYSGYHGTMYPYRWSAPYRYSAWRNYGTWNNWAYPYNSTAWNYPYNWNYGWGTPAAGLASIAAAPFEVAGAAAAAPLEVAGAAATAPFAVAANATTPVMTGRSVAVGPYYVRHTHWTRHARYIRPGIMTGRSVAVERCYRRHMNYGRSAYVHKKY
jgi:hypothetical protein